MLLVTRRVATGLLLVPFGGMRLADAAPVATAQVTFVLVNDIYQMADQAMADAAAAAGSRGSRRWSRPSAPRPPLPGAR
jgi:hypothetical protein